MFLMSKNIKCLHAYCRKSVDTVYTLLEVIIFREEVYFCDSANNVLFPIQLKLQKIHYYAFFMNKTHHSTFFSQTFVHILQECQYPMFLLLHIQDH